MSDERRGEIQKDMVETINNEPQQKETVVIGTCSFSVGFRVYRCTNCGLTDAESFEECGNCGEVQ